MKRILSLILAGLMAVSLLAGCSNTDNGGNTSNSGQTNQTSNVQENEGNNNGPDIEEIRKNGLPDDLSDLDIEYEKKENDEWKYRDYGTFVAITGYSGSSTKIHIPDEIDGKPVLSILGLLKSYFPGEWDSMPHDYVTITMTDNIIHLGGSAFSMCPQLESITLSKNIKRISENTFKYDNNLKKVVLPENLERIEAFAFAGCSQLETTVPDSVKFIGRMAFEHTPYKSEMNAKIQELKEKYPELYEDEN